MSYKDYINSIDIPSYTRKQESFNAFTHALGLPLAFIILLISFIKFFNNALTVPYFIGLNIFVLSIVAVYLVSTLYHATFDKPFRKKFLRVLDHCTIFLLIAGTYTPICIYLFDIHIVGLVMLIIEWSGALIGIFLNAFFFKNKIVQVISLILYLALGWLCLFSGGFLYMPMLSFAFILAGGIVYSIGSILYSIGHKNLNFHSIFHIFVLVSTIVQAIGVLVLFF